MSIDLSRCMTSGLNATGLIALILLAACAAPPPPERPAAPSSELTFDAGVDYAIDDLLVQARRLPSFSAPPGLFKKEPDVPRGVIAVDPAIDGNTGQQTLASKALDSRLLQRASDKFAQFDVAAVNSTILGKAQYLLAATLTPIDAAKGTAGTFRISLSLTDIKTGFVVAQSAARVRSEGVDTTPTPFYRDSPSLTKDRVVEGQIRTAQTPTGSAADEFYMSRLPINALISEGSNRYEAGNYAEALRYYETAAARPEGQQLRVLNGLYLANTQLGRTDDAERAFAKTSWDPAPTTCAMRSTGASSSRFETARPHAGAARVVARSPTSGRAGKPGAAAGGRSRPPSFYRNPLTADRTGSSVSSPPR